MIQVVLLKVVFATSLLVIMFLMGYWEGRRAGWTHGYNIGYQDGHSDGLEQKSLNDD